MQRWSTILLVILLTAGSHAQYEKGIAKVRSALAKDKPYKAISHAQRVLLKNDTLAEVLVLRADAYNRIGKSELALRDARKAMKSMPNDVDVRAQMIASYLGLGRPDSAMVYILDGPGPKNELYLFRKATTYMRVKDHDRALSVLDEGVRDFPNSVRLVRDRGACHALLGDSAKARIDLDKAVQLAPRDPVNYNHRGFYRYAMFGEHAKAIDDMERAIKLDPNYGYAFSNRGWSRYVLGDTTKAIRDLRLAARKNASNSYAYRYLGQIELNAGNIAAACEHFHTAVARGYTRSQGQEVQDLIDANCGSVTPVPGTTEPNVPGSAPQKEPPPSNAPGKAPTKSNAP